MNSHRYPTLTKEERTKVVTKTYKTLFKKGDVFEVKKGINVLVGDNGCGKSTLIREFMDACGVENRIFVDMEKSKSKSNNPSTKKST